MWDLSINLPATPWAKNIGAALPPYFGTIGLYLAVANMIGMFGITPPQRI